jgi:hypothetical protein
VCIRSRPKERGRVRTHCTSPSSVCAHYSTVAVVHKQVVRKRGGGRSSIVTLLGRRSPGPSLAASTSSLHLAQSTSPSSSTPVLSLDELESMVDTGSFDSLPSLPHILEGIQPLLDDEEYTDIATSQDLFTRLRAALLKKLDHDQEKSAADKAEKKKRKETHSVTVCIRSTQCTPLLIRRHQNLVRAWRDTCRQLYAEQVLITNSGFCTTDRCCDSCEEDECVYSCRDCTGVCFSRRCILAEHRYTPLHRIEVRMQIH